MRIAHARLPSAEPIHFCTRGANRGIFPVELLYGAFPQSSVGVGTSSVYGSRTRSTTDRSVMCELGVLDYSTRTLTLPSFA